MSGYDKKSTEGSREVKFTLSDGMIALPVLIDVYSVDENFPSIEPAKIRVTPKEAEWPFIVDDNVGVENIGADEMYVEISGGTGEVTAPLGAEIYNMNGIRTGNRNLPAGIYIVRYGNRVEKVFVK